MIYTYDSSYWKTYEQGNSMEWVMTNGIGGYAGAGLTGGQNRTHQGYLVASLHAPVRRYVCLENICEWITVGGKTYDIETAQHRRSGKTVFSEGQKFLREVSYDGTVNYRYELTDGNESEKNAGVISFSKHLGLLRGKNTAAAAYVFNNDSAYDAEVILTPAFNFREHNTLTDESDINFMTLLTGDTLSLVPEENRHVRIDFSISEGDYCELADKYDRNCELQTEVDLETEGLCTRYTPYDISLKVKAGSTKKVSVVCSVTVTGENGPEGGELLDQAADVFVGPFSAEKLLKPVVEYYEGLCEKAGYEDEFAKRLVLDADHFLTYRCSTGKKTILAGLPWFTDWGRDTMIAFTGLTLCTGRFEEAGEILLTFAEYVHHGMVPNMFPDDDAEPLYNTADASLWYFYAVYKYLEYTGKADKILYPNAAADAESLIREKIYPVLKEILTAYEKGTDFSIYMEPDGLLHAGSDLDQITWMDVRVGDMVVTPRHGCPVEINALWYNALCIGNELAEKYGDTEAADHWSELARKVHDIYDRVYWNPERNCLYDVADGDFADDSLRPNQIYAVSLPFSLLTGEHESAVVKTVYDELYVGVGLRSLSRDHRDYHGQYRGALEKRDLSYHQGTAWGFLLGGFITAYAKVHSGEPGAAAELKKLFAPIIKHQSEENCVGGICEVFEGDAPHAGRGCYTQAWSTGEVLRAYVEAGLSDSRVFSDRR